MRIERVFLEKITTVQLDIGYVGEHDHCRVIIDSASLLAYYPNAVAGMVAKSPAGVLYPVALQQDGNDVIWNVSDSDLARAGIGTFQLTFTQNGEIIKTAHGSYKVDPSLLAEGDPPDPIETWIEEANQKLAEVSEAVQEATEAAENADSKASEAEEATSDANAAAALANEKATLADQKATLADTAASSANTAASSATSAASSATSAASSATSAASSANTAASTANTAAGKIDNMTVAASSSQTPTATITEVDGHKHILFGLVKGDAGKDFHIAKTFSSIAQMMAYTGTDIEAYDFAMIDTGSVQDPDTGKLYCYEPETQERWRYIGDLSGAQGIKGETGTGISSIALNQDYTLTIYLDDGTSYTTTSIRGAKGDQGDPGTPGTPGDPGPAGQNAYVYIRYSTSEPVQDSDMHTTPDNWMGIYSGTSSTAPTAYTDYAWYKIKGETGSATNVYGTTVPMSEQDSTKVATAIGNKLDANQGSANAGKFMKVGNDGSLVPDTVPDPTGKADKVQNATSGNFAGLDANGNLTDSGSKASDFLTQHQDISGKADKVQNATSGNFAGLDANGNLTDSGSKASDFLTQHQDISGKADKVSGATTGNFAGLDANGNLTDSGKKPSDFLTQHQDISGKVDKNQGVAYAGKALGINDQGMVEPVPFSGEDFTGATGSTAGVHGLVPAPAAGDQDKVLYGDGTWKIPGGGTLRVVPFSIGVASWSLSNGVYSYTFPSAYVTATSVEFIEYDSSYREAVRGDVNAVKATGGGGVVFTTDVLPVATLSGEIRVFDSDDGKVAIVTQMTALPTMREVPFTLAVADWALNADDLYEAVFATAFVTATSHDFIEFDENIENATDGIKVTKASTGMKFLTRRIPAGPISGTITPLDNADGKIAVALESTVMPIANGGTGANTLAGAQSNLGITALQSNVAMINDFTPNTEVLIGTWVDGKPLYRMCFNETVNISSSSGSTDTNVLDIGEGKSIVLVHASMKGSSSRYILPYVNGSTGAATVMLTNSNMHQLMIRVYKDSWSNGNLNAIVYYTYNSDS